MKHFLIVPLALIALTFANCSGVDKSVFEGGLSITATVQNPVTREQQAAVEASYQVAASAALSYARLRRCEAGETASPTNLCSEWAVVQKLKRANRTAYSQLVKLRDFMDNNETISAISAFNSVQKALADFKAIANTAGV